MTWTLKINEDSVVILPEDLIQAILKSNHTRSKKRRIQKKVVQRVVNAALKDLLQRYEWEAL